MDIIEHTDSRLVIKAPISRGAAWSGSIVGIFGIILLTNIVTVDGNHYIWHVLVPIACLVYGLLCLVSIHSSLLCIDKVEGSITRQNSFMFATIGRTKSMALADISQFRIRHINTYKWNPTAIQFIFCINHKKLTFKSDRLHFGAGMNKTDPRNSNEETIGQFVAEFTGLPITVKDKMIDSKNIKTRSISIILLLVAGAATALAGTWIYFHLVQ